jgi:hypothetical protein
MAEALSSLWGGLSEHLIAQFYEVDRDGKRTDPDVTVKAPLTDAQLDFTFAWQSPFENAGPETKAPTLFAMLQSGAINPIIESVAGKPSAGGAQQKSAEFLKQFEGRTGITKLNSTQVFSGMPPGDCTITALFRAWKDPIKEVEEPYNQLMLWAFPQELAKDSTLLTGATNAVKGDKGWIEATLPSKSPTLIAMKYKGEIYAPLVIESIGKPLSSPIDANGRFVELLVPMKLSTLTAWDRNDWKNIKG